MLFKLVDESKRFHSLVSYKNVLRLFVDHDNDVIVAVVDDGLLLLFHLFLSLLMYSFLLRLCWT